VISLCCPVSDHLGPIGARPPASQACTSCMTSVAVSLRGSHSRTWTGPAYFCLLCCACCYLPSCTRPCFLFPLEDSFRKALSCGAAKGICMHVLQCRNCGNPCIAPCLQMQLHYAHAGSACEIDDEDDHILTICRLQEAKAVLVVVYRPPGAPPLPPLPPLPPKPPALAPASMRRLA
jgi:hypothetical protein